jgi:hypothetical protein
MIQIQVKGLNKLNGFLRGLPQNLNREISKESELFMIDVSKSAKLRAPRYTGFLASSIHVYKRGKTITLEVTAPYAYEEETGEGLPRQVPIRELKSSGWTPEASRTRGGLKKGIGIKAKKGFFIKRSYKPFVAPALEHHIGKLSQRMGRATDKAIKRSVR